MRNLQTHFETISETEIERGILHHRDVYLGKVYVDLITDGKQEFLPNDQGQYEEAHGDAAATLKAQIGEASLEMTLAQADSIQLTKHEQVDGAATSVYTLRERFGTTMPEVIRVWIADADHRPLKVEEELRAATAQYQEGIVMQTTSTIYSYNPDVRVRLPGK